MGILGTLGRGAFGLVKGATTGGFAARTAIGAGIGGVAGAIQGDYANPNARIESIIKGAALGATVGGALGLNKSIGRMMAPRALRKKAESVIGKHAFEKQWSHVPAWGKDTAWRAERQSAFREEFAKKASAEAWKYTPTSMLAKSIFKNPMGAAGEGFLARNKRIGQERLRSYLGDTLGAETFVQSRGDIAARYSPLGRAAAAPTQMLSSIVNHPYLALGGVGIAAATYAGVTSPASPTLSGDVERAQKGLNATTKVNYNTQAMAAHTLRESGVAPMGAMGTVPQMMGPMQQAFQKSTSGVVQGLHRGRHG